nr:hypothetical protein [Tanacetum cinerariifolium]
MMSSINRKNEIKRNESEEAKIDIAYSPSQVRDHTSDWLRKVPIFGLGQTMNACSRVFAEDFYEERTVSCAGIIGIKYRHNVVCDTLIDICYRSGISAGHDVCADLTGSSPLTQIGMVDFVPCCAVVDAAQRKRVKYIAKCAAIRYGFLSFSFSSFRELEEDDDLAETDPKVFHGLGHWGTLYYGEHNLWSHQGVQQGDLLGPILFALVLHPLICKIKDSFILSLHAYYLDNGTIIGDTLVVGKVMELIMEDGPRGHVSVDFDFSSELVLKRVAKSIELLDAVFKLNDPQCELLLLHACAGISKLHFPMHMCSPRVIKQAQHSFYAVLRSSLERIVTASGPEFGDWQWRLATLPFSSEGLGVLQKLADIYFTSITQTAESNFSSSTRQMALWKSQMEDHTSNWLRVVPISRVFMGDIYRDHVVPCAGIVGSLPLTQTEMVDFVPGRAVIEAGQRKRAKYEAKCANIGYGFSPFSFSSFGELEKDAMTLLKRI